MKKFMAVENLADMWTEFISLYKYKLSLGSIEIYGGQASIEVLGSCMIDKPYDLATIIKPK